MKIIHLNTHDSGGSCIYARTLSEALCEAGHDSVVLHRSLSDRPFGDKLLRRASLAMARGSWHGTRRTLHPPPRDLIESADVVHLHTMADWFDVPGWAGRLPRRVRLVVSLHDLWHASGGCFVYGACDRFRSDCRPCPVLRFPANQRFAASELRRKVAAYGAADARFVANSRWLRDLVKDSPVLHGRDIAVVPPPVDPAVFHPMDRAACRARFDLSDGDLVLATGCASLTDANKDTIGLLGMLAELAHPGLKVLVFGDGKIAIPGNLQVQPLGPINDKRELAMVYGAADVFASASKMETYGMTLAEAYACGCAVIAHDTGGIPEALPEDRSVSLVPVGDRPAFINALRLQLQRSSTAKSSGGAGRAPSCAPSPEGAINLLLPLYATP